jgi:hypothetical protein
VSSALWPRSHTPWIALARGCCTLLVLSPGSALAWAEAPPAVERSGFSFDLRVVGGGASAEFTENDRRVADFEALALGGSARFGWFLGPHVLIGAELTSSWHAGVGTLTVHDPSYFNRGVPSAAEFTVIAPLGVFAEVYPWRDSGWFLAVAGGVGFMDLPSFAPGDSNVYMSGYSLDAGYEFSGRAKRGPALFVRYSRWAGEEFIVSDHPDGISSRELLLGLRWSFWTPEWQ